MASSSEIAAWWKVGVDDLERVVEDIEREVEKEPKGPRPPRPLLSFNCTHCNVSFATCGGRPLYLDIYLPPPTAEAASRALSPAVLFVHGGGWQSPYRDHGINRTLQLLPRGVAVVTFDYRLTSQAGAWGGESVIFPAQLDDSVRALAWVRANGSRFGLDPARVGAWGESSGGHLAALLATEGAARGGATRLACAVDMFGPTDLLQRFAVRDGVGVEDQLLGFNLSEARHRIL